MKDLKLLFTFFALMISLSVNAVIQEGKCGDNVNYILDDNRVLTISGTGELWNYSDNYRYRAPWYNNRSKIEIVKIEHGVTSIGDYSFYECTMLTSIITSESVNRIGKGSFYDCAGLINITIPSFVTSIGDYAFWHCSGLASINIPNSVNSIGDYAFSGCLGLTSINIPNSMNSIGSDAFSYCM